MIEITSDILNFSLFLDKTWKMVQLFIDEDDINNYYEDWLQANWEILVEAKICKPNEFLQLYCNGADCYGEYSRVTYFDKVPTQKVIGLLVKKPTYDFYNHEQISELTNYTFHCFINVENDIGKNTPPFEYVEFEHDTLDKIVWLNKNDIKYYVIPII